MIYLSDRHPESVLPFTTHQRVDQRRLSAASSRRSVPVTADSAGRDICARRPAGVAGASGARASGSARRTWRDRPAAPAASNGRPLAVSGAGGGGARSGRRDDRGRYAARSFSRAFSVAAPTPGGCAPSARRCRRRASRRTRRRGPSPIRIRSRSASSPAARSRKPAVRRADLIIAFGLDPVELIPRRVALHGAGVELHALPVRRSRHRVAGRWRLLRAGARGGGRPGLDPRGAGAASGRAARRWTGTWWRWIG